MYSNVLKKLREEKKLTQEVLANLLNIDRSQYGKYENEYVIIPLKHLNALCNYFHVSLDYIFEFTTTAYYKNILQDIDLQTAGQRLKQFRKEHKLTQEKLASILNTVHPVITNYEKGKHLISTPFLYTICKKYNVSADYLLGKTNSPKYQNKQ